MGKSWINPEAERAAWRGLQLQASAVKQTAIAHAIPVAQPRSLRLDGKYPDEAQAGQAALQAAQLDVLVVAVGHSQYRALMPEDLRSLCRGQRPILSEEAISEARSRFVIEPLEPGFGYTLGNSLRRTLLSSIPGAAVTSLRIDDTATPDSPVLPIAGRTLAGFWRGPQAGIFLHGLLECRKVELFQQWLFQYCPHLS